jgi:hypothetical protein
MGDAEFGHGFHAMRLRVRLVPTLRLQRRHIRSSPDAGAREASASASAINISVLERERVRENYPSWIRVTNDAFRPALFGHAVEHVVHVELSDPRSGLMLSRKDQIQFVTDAVGYGDTKIGPDGNVVRAGD